MATRYRRSFDLATGMPSTGQSQAYDRIASSLSSFSRTMGGIAAEYRTAEGQREAAMVEPSAQKPELKSPYTYYGKAYNRTVMEGHLAATQNAYEMQLGELAQKYATDPQAFAENAQAVRASILSDVAPEISQAVSTRFDRTANSYLLNIHGAFEKLSTQTAINEINQSIQNSQASVARLIAQGDELGAMGEVETYNNLILESGSLTDIEKQKYIAQMQVLVAEQSTLSDLDDLDLVQAYAKLDEFAQDVPPTHTPDEWNKFISSAQSKLNARSGREARAQAAVVDEHARAASDLEVAITAGVGDPQAQVAQIDEFFSVGAITAQKRTQLLNLINANSKKAIDDLIVAQNINKRLGGDSSPIVDPKDVDEYYAKVFSKNLPEQANPNKALFVERMRYIPQSLKAEIDNGLRSGDTDLMIQAADLLDRIDEISGLPQNSFSTQNRAFASIVLPMLGYMPPEKAVELALKNTDPADQNRIEGRKTAFAEEFGNKQKQDEYFMAEINDRFDSQFFGTDVDDLNKDTLRNDFRDLTEQYVIAGMDFDAAQDQAQKDMDRVWGTSEITGESRAMKYPPEKYYAFSEDNSWMHDQLIEDLEEEGFAYESVYLISDDTTAREASTGKPSYIVTLQDEDGMLMPLIDYKGKKGRWTPDRELAIQKAQEEIKQQYESERGAKISGAAEDVLTVRESLRRGLPMMGGNLSAQISEMDQ